MFVTTSRSLTFLRQRAWPNPLQKVTIISYMLMSPVQKKFLFPLLSGIPVACFKKINHKISVRSIQIALIYCYINLYWLLDFTSIENTFRGHVYWLRWNVLSTDYFSKDREKPSCLVWAAQFVHVCYTLYMWNYI